MRVIYAFQHWLFTLLLTPFTSLAIEYIWKTDTHKVIGLLEIYPLTLLFSIVFSLPAFLIYLICFYCLSKQKLKLNVSKFILTAIAIICVYITLAVIKMGDDQIMIAYSLTALILGLALKLKATKTETTDHHISAENPDYTTGKFTEK